MAKSSFSGVDRLLTTGDLATMLQIPVASLYAQRYRGVPPGSLGMQVGKYLRFRASDVEQWLDELSEAGSRRG